MKNAMLKNAFSEIKKTKSRFFSIFGIIAIGTGFFAGLLSSAPDMKLSADSYFDDSNLMNYRVISTFGFNEKDIEELESIEGLKVYPGYFTDAFIHTDAGDKVARVYSLDKLGENNECNNLQIIEGRLPENENECIIDSGKLITGYSIGDKITLTGDSDTDITDTLSVTEYTIVGKFNTSMFISDTERGTTTIGTGSVSMLVYVPAENFSVEYYTQVFACAEQLLDYNCYSDEYIKLSDEIKEKLEAAAENREEERFAEIKTEGEKKLSESQKELDDKKKEAEEKIADGEKELEDAKKELDDGKIKLEEGEQKLRDSKIELDNAKTTLDSTKLTLESSKKQLDDAQTLLAEKKPELEAGAAQLADSKKQLDEGKAQLDKAKKELDNAQQQLADSKKQLDDAKAQLDEKKPELVAAKLTLEQSKAELDAGKVKLEESEKTLEESKAKLDEAYAKLAEEQQTMDESYKALQDKIDKGEISNISAKLAKKALDALQAVLDESWAQYNDGLKQYNDGYAQYLAGIDEYNDGYARYEEGLKQYNDGCAQYEAGLKQYNDGVAKYEEGLKQYNEGYAKYSEEKEKFDAGYAEYEAGLQKYNESYALYNTSQNEIILGYLRYYDGLEQYNNGVKQYEDGLQQYNDGVAELESKRLEYEEGVRKYEEGVEKLDSSKADAEAEFEKAQKKIDSAKRELSDLDQPLWYVMDRNDNPGYEEYGQNAERIKNIALVFPAFFVLVAALVCLTTMTRMVEEQRTQIGTLKALGYGNGSIIFKYMLYALTAAVLGSVFGTLIGLKMFPAIIISAYGMLYKLPAMKLPYDYVLMSLTTLAAGILAAGTVYFSCNSILSEQPAGLMRPKAPKSGKKILLERVGFVWKHLTFSHKVTMRNIFRYKRRMLMTVIGIAGCTALVLTGFGVYDSINDIMYKQFDEISNNTGVAAYSDSISYTNRQKLDETLRECGADIGDVYQKEITVLANDKSNSANIFAAKDNEVISKFVTIKNRLTNERYSVDDSGVIINEKLAALLGGVQKGDTVTLSLTETRRVDVKVSEICENYAHHYVYITEKLYSELTGEDVPYNCVYFNIDGGDDLSEQERNEISRKLMDIDGVLAVSFKTAVEGTFKSMLKSLELVVLVLIVSAGVLAFIVLYNLTNININERIREIATLKVLGFYDKEVSMYVFRETIILTLLGTVTGLLFGRVLVDFVIRTAEIDMVMFGRDVHPTSYIISVVITLVFALVVTLVMHRHLKKVDMVEALKSVE